MKEPIVTFVQDSYLQQKNYKVKNGVTLGVTMLTLYAPTVFPRINA